MKLARGFLVPALFAAGLLAATRTSDGAPTAAPAPVASTPAGDAASGKAMFTQHCSICHGAGATGFIGPSIAGVNWTAPGLHAIVRGGVGGYGSMPAFAGDAVTEKDIADIAVYLASLPPAPAPKAATASQTTAESAAAAASSASSAAPPSSSGGDPSHGRQIFTANCAACHGASAQGGIGPSLLAEKSRKNTAAAISWIKNPLPPMPKLYPTVLSEKDVADVAAFVESL